MTFFIVQYGLAMFCMLVAAWRCYYPNDTIARITFGAAIGFFFSIWTASFLLPK